MSAAELVAAAREFADGLDVSLTEAGNARIHITRLADMIEQLTTDLDARFAESDHTAAKYYQRMRAAEKESVMRRSESADFEKERDEAVARLEATEEGLFQVVQAIGEDTDGARNAAEYFGPLTICTTPPITDPVGITVHRVAQYRREMEAEAERADERARAAEKELRDRELHHFEEEQRSAGLTSRLDRVHKLSQPWADRIDLEQVGTHSPDCHTRHVDCLILSIRHALSIPEVLRDPAHLNGDNS